MIRLAALACTLAVVGGTTTALAQPSDIRVTPVVSDDEIAVSFVAPDAFSEDALAVVKSGLLLTFRFTVELRRPSGFWWDRTIRSVTAGSSAKFDSLTGVYHVSKLVDGHVVWSDRTTDLTEVRAWMTTFESVPVMPRTALEPNDEYYLQVSLRATPRRRFTFWPWGSDGTGGRADFTNVR